MSELFCEDCGNKIENGMKAYEDRYFFNLHCSLECLVEYMLDFFNNDRTPNVTVIDGKTYHDEELNENGKPVIY